MATCSNPGCDQPGTHHGSACKSKNYCGPKCQTADWPNHKEECPGHLRKIGIAHIVKAKRFQRANNWPQTLHHANLAVTKLKQMKDRPVELVDGALRIKYDALTLGSLGQHSEALECAKERYCLYLTNHTHPPAIEASFAVIESCIFNEEYYDAALFARTLWETITLSRDSHIPDNQRDDFTARGAFELARALHHLAADAGMPKEEQKETGVEATMLARRSLEINTQLHGAESREVANSMEVLASVLDYFNDVDDDEVTRLLEQVKAIFARVYGTLSVNVASTEHNLGVMYERRAKRANGTHDLDRCIANLELAMPHFRDSARIYRAINNVKDADESERILAHVQELLRITVDLKAAESKV